jgi:coatomer subunit beta'
MNMKTYWTIYFPFVPLDYTSVKMPLKLDIRKLLSARTDRVKSVDFHPTEPWVLAGLYSGSVMIWDYTTQALVRQMEVSNLPIRCAKFIVRRQWIVVGCDDMTVKILNYNTLERIKSLEGHTDYIRHIAVHPTLPLVLTSSDDMTIRMWDWEKNWECTNTFEGHSHYVMMVQWNPKDSSSFASASLDRSIKIWGMTGGAHFTLNGHQRGVNCIDFASGDKPYLVSGSDDKTVRVWDFQTKQCVHLLEGHTANVSSVAFHPTLPLILSGSEDGICKLWHATTFRLETSLNYMLDRLWSIAVLPKGGSNVVALGYDEGAVVLKLGSDEPVVSYCGGKLIWAKGVDIQTVNMKQIDASALTDIEDGESISSLLPVKDMGACELFPQSIAHHPSGRLFAVCGDGEYVIYTAQALRNKSFGQALGFAWSPEGHYATRDGNGKISIFHNFKEAFSFRTDFAVDDIHSGELLGVRGPDFIVFYDWNEYRVVRRIDLVCNNVFWSESGKFVALSAHEALYVLAYDREAVAAATAGGVPPEEGVEIAFELHNEVQESVKSGVWVGDSCFVFVNDRLKLNTLVGGQVEVAAHLDKPLTVLGYLPELGRVFCCDKSLSVVKFDLDLNLVKYKSAIAGNDFATAEGLFVLIPETQHTRLARFLESQGYRAEAYEITKDLDHKFELAISLGRLAEAAQLVDASQADQGSAAAKRRQIGDKALETGDLVLAQKSFLLAGDSSSLLLIASCTGDEKLLVKVAEIAKQEGKLNVEIMARTLCGDVHGVVESLLKSEKFAEAALFARSYCPSMLERVYPRWKADVESLNVQLAKALADPASLPGMKEAIIAEHVVDRMGPIAAGKIEEAHRLMSELDFAQEIREKGEDSLVKRLGSVASIGPASLRKAMPVSSQDFHSPRAAKPAVVIPTSQAEDFHSPKSMEIPVIRQSPKSVEMPVVSQSPRSVEMQSVRSQLPQTDFHSPRSVTDSVPAVSKSSLPGPPANLPSPPVRTTRLPTPPAMPSRPAGPPVASATSGIRGPPPIPSRVRAPELAAQSPHAPAPESTEQPDLL